MCLLTLIILLPRDKLTFDLLIGLIFCYLFVFMNLRLHQHSQTFLLEREGKGGMGYKATSFSWWYPAGIFFLRFGLVWERGCLARIVPRLRSQRNLRKSTGWSGNETRPSRIQIVLYSWTRLGIKHQECKNPQRGWRSVWLSLHWNWLWSSN